MNYFQNFGVNSARKLREFFAKACVNKAFLRKRLVGFIGGLHGNILREREREQLHILKNRRENSVVAALVVFADIHSVQQDRLSAVVAVTAVKVHKTAEIVHLTA